MKTHDWILLWLVVSLFVLGILTFFFKPLDPEDAKIIIESFIASVAMVLSFKFGVHVATPAPGTDMVVSTKTPPQPEPVKE